MPPDAPQLVVGGLFLLALLGMAVAVEARVIRRIRRDGGQVRTEQFRMPDALVAIVLALFFVGMGISATFRHAAKGDAVTIDQVLPGSLVFAILLIGVAGFLKYRRVQLIPLLGLNRLSAIRVVGWALGLVLTGFAFTGAANALTVAALHGKAAQQPLILLFRELAGQNDVFGVAKIAVAGVVIAPICEEFIFRGFFYAVGKRYLGPIASGLACALLFAAFHLSITALAGLFVFALCLTIAYERTGSLLVPIGMHALFNASGLLLTYLQARGFFSAP